MSILAIATVLSTQIPDAALDRTWGHLMRAQHHVGAWNIQVDGKRLSGEWITVDMDNQHDPRFYHGRLIHLTSSSGAYCAITIGDIASVHCEVQDKTEIVNVQLAKHDVEAILAGSAIMRYESYSPPALVAAGTLTSKVWRVTPTLAQAQQLFHRIYKRTLAEAIGAQLVPGRGLVLRMPYQLQTFLGSTGGLDTPGISSTQVIEVEATIELAIRTTKITPRETARYIEDCETSNQPMGCSYSPPRICTRR